MTNKVLFLAMAGVGLSIFLIASMAGMGALQTAGEGVAIDNDDLG